MPVRCAIYVRQSIQHAEGIERSLARTRALVAARGWQLDERHVFVDDGTSAKDARGAKTAWARMLKGLEAGDFTVVVGVDLDRLIRSISDLGVLIRLGAQVVIVDGDLDLTTADGRLRASILTAAAAFEVERKSERQKRSNEWRVSQGRPVPGKRRFGYEADGVTPRPSEVPVVEDIYRGIIARESVRSLSVKYGRTATFIKSVVQNKAYAGYIKFRGEFSAEPGAIVPIVTLDEWERANLILSDPTRKSTPGPTPRHLMSGLAQCGLCGNSVHFTTRSYQCRGRNDHVSVAKRYMDTAVSEAVFLWAMGEAGTTPADSEGLTSLLAELAEVERQREAQEELYSLPGASKARIAKRLAALGTEADRLTQAINSERAGESVSGVLAAVRGDWADGDAEFPEEAEKAAEAWPAYWAGLGLEVQRDLVRALLRVTVDKGNGRERVRIEYV